MLVDENEETLTCNTEHETENVKNHPTNLSVKVNWVKKREKTKKIDKKIACLKVN